MWNPFSYNYTPIKKPILRAAVAVILLPVQLVWFVIFELGGKAADKISSLVVDGRRK